MIQLRNLLSRLTLITLIFHYSILINGQIVLQSKEPPAEMKNLDFLIGKWENDGGEWYDMEGNPTVVKKSKEFKKKNSFNQILPIMGGLYLEGGAQGEVVRSYYFYHTGEQKYYHIAMDFIGSLSIMTGNIVDEKLIFKDIKAQKYNSPEGITWRRTFYDISEDSHTYNYEYSTDGGKTWSLRGKQRAIRFEEGDTEQHYSSNSLLKQLEPFIGNWHMIPDSAALANYPEMANSIGFKFEWAREDKNILKFYEGVREGKIEKALLECNLSGNPRTREIEFQGYQNMNDFFYKGKFLVERNGTGYTREYDVYYPHGTKFQLKEDKALGMKTYRDVCQLIGRDTMKCLTEQLDRGKWNPWGNGDPYLLTRKPIQGASIPGWVEKHWKDLTQGSGTWITDNSKYKSEQEPFDQYGLDWEYGIGNKHLRGRLYCIRGEEDAGTLWQFTEYWDPISQRLKVFQIGSDGTLGSGDLMVLENGKMKEKQLFASPGGGTFIAGHEAWMDGSIHHTNSFDIVEEIWKERRSYSWNLESEEEMAIPTEYEQLSYLIGKWESKFGENTAQMIFTWGENKRTIHFENRFKPGKAAKWKKENEGLITYNGILKKPVFITSYASTGSQLMAEGSFSFNTDGVIHREFSCYYPEGERLPWSDGARAPAGGETIKFQQIWTPLDDNAMDGEFLWQQNGEWDFPIKKDGQKFRWKRTK